MTILETGPVQTTVAKLIELLKHADQIKPSCAIEPPLSASDFGDALMELLTPGPDIKKDAPATVAHLQTRYAIIETAIRDLFNNLIASTSIDDASFVQIWNLLDIVSIFSDDERCEPGLVALLIEELLDSQTIEGCKRVFDYLESRREQITANHFSQKNLTLLRSCNELLRRLSRAENTVFCGRVFIFLFQSFPLGDKSSVNLRGQYHVGNTTTYDDNPAKPDSDQERMHMDAQAIADDKQDNGAVESNSDTKDSSSRAGVDNPTSADVSQTKTAQPEQQIDSDTIYPIFWSLQQYFSDPTRLFEESNFAAFRSGLGTTIERFTQAQRDTDGRSALLASENNKHGTKRKRGDVEEGLASGFNPKYLTSRDLFDLEISDLAFRRHILVQSLIILDFLQSLSPKSKAKLGSLNTQNQSVLYQHTLSDEDVRWANDVRMEIAAYLQQGPEGKFFYRMVDTVLSRDKNWVQWKIENCPPIQQPPITSEQMLAAKNGVAKASTQRRLRTIPVGSFDLSFLSEAESARGLEKLRKPERYNVPDAKSFEAAIVNDDFDIDLAKDQDERQQATDARASKAWRALRIASKSRLFVFDKIDDNAQSLNALFQPDLARDVREAENGVENPEDKVEMASAARSDPDILKTAEVAAPASTAVDPILAADIDASDAK